VPRTTEHADRCTQQALRCIVALTVSLTVTTPTLAHFGDLEELSDVAVHPLNPDVIVVRYSHKGEGLMYSSDGGATWGMLCGSAVGDDLVISGRTVITGDGNTITGSFGGLWEGSSDGCDWQRGAALEGMYVSDLTRDPTDPNVVYAITGSGAEGTLNRMARRAANGSWSEVGSGEAMMLLRVRAAATASGVRLYQLVQQGVLSVTVDGNTRDVPNYMIRVSDDGGETWRAHPLQVDWGTVTLEAVDPNNADRLIVNVRRYGEADSILVSDDQGETFHEYATITEFGALTLAPDGRIWVGDVGDPSDSSVTRGIWFGATLDTAPVKLPDSDYPVLCLHYEPTRDTLYACQRWWFGPVDQTTGEFSLSLNIIDTPQFISCDGDLAATCEPQLCSGLCGSSGFGDAPVCSMYRRPDCGPCRESSPNANSAECRSEVLGGGSKAKGGCSIAPGHQTALPVAWLLACFLLRRALRLRSLRQR